MSGKFISNIWQETKEFISLCISSIPTIGTSLFWFFIGFIVLAILYGIPITVCWNVAFTTMFGFNKITFFQAVVLAFTIEQIKFNYVDSIESWSNMVHKEAISGQFKKMKIFLVILTILSFMVILLSIFVAVLFTKYSWNAVIPQLLNVELAKINFIQAFGFAFLCNFFLNGFKSSKKSKKENITTHKVVYNQRKEYQNTKDIFGKENDEKEKSIWTYF